MTQPCVRPVCGEPSCFLSPTATVKGEWANKPATLTGWLKRNPTCNRGSVTRNGDAIPSSLYRKTVLICSTISVLADPRLQSVSSLVYLRDFRSLPSSLSHACPRFVSCLLCKCSGDHDQAIKCIKQLEGEGTKSTAGGAQDASFLFAKCKVLKLDGSSEVSPIYCG